MSIKYENPLKTQNRVAKLEEYLVYLESLTESSDLLENKCSYEAFFFIGKTFSITNSADELYIVLERKLAQIFVKTLKYLNEIWQTLNLNNDGKTAINIELDEPIGNKYFKESIFCYVLYSINVLNRIEKRFSIDFVEANDGLESILSFLRDENFIKNNLKSGIIIFNGDRMRIIKVLIANLTGLSKNMEEFANNCNDLVEVIFSNIIKNNDITSDVIFSAYLLISTICNESQIENEFKSIPEKFKTYLRTCSEDFSNSNQNLHRESREIIVDQKTIKIDFYAIDLDKCGANTTLNVILSTLCTLASKNQKFRSIIYKELKSDLDILLEKGEKFEKKLTLDIYNYLSLDDEIRSKMIVDKKLSDIIINLKSKNIKELKNAINQFEDILGIRFESKGSFSTDFSKTNRAKTTNMN